MSEARDGQIERVIDANANRAREGLRVAEDFARFVVADESLAGELRESRHRVTEIVRRVAPPHALLAARDTPGDLGADANAFPPAARTTPEDVAAGALKRAEEALRSLAEFAKLVDPLAAAAFERERYDLYDLERRVLLTRADLRRIERIDLCAVMDAGLPPAPADVAGAACEAGAGCIVIEPGALGDARTLSLARGLRETAASRGVLVLVGGRADMARLAGADGVLLGPDDVSPPEARRVLGHGAVVGRKVPDAEEARVAFEEGATFAVVPFANVRGMANASGPAPRAGPTSDANASGMPPGFEGPWFASALTPEHVGPVIEAGARRIALGLPDSPEEAAELVRGARAALDTAKASAPEA